MSFIPRGFTGAGRERDPRLPPGQTRVADWPVLSAGPTPDVSTEDYRRRLTSLKLVEWLDDAGMLPEEHSPERWAAENPDAASFVGADGEMPSIQELYQNRNKSPADQQAWIDFKRYYENSGGAWLSEIDVDEQYQLGWIIEDNGGG